jgi:hypothetical protein
MDFVTGLIQIIKKDFKETDPYICFPNGQCIHLSGYHEVTDSSCFQDKEE